MVWRVSSTVFSSLRSMSPHASRSRALVTMCVAAAVLGAPAAARSATLGFEQRCYIAGEPAALSGSGFSAGPVGLTLADAAIKPVDADASGSFRTRIEAPQVAEGLLESQAELVATDGTTTARAIINLVRAGADYEAGEDRNPRTMRVRHKVSGFGLSLTRPSVYLHYVSPAARRAASATTQRMTARATAGGSAGFAPNPPGVYSRRIGQLRGPCGVLRTSPRKLFPFKSPAKGKWELQYDTNPRYTRGVSSSPFYWVRKSVTIK